MLRPQSRILIVDDEPPLRKALRASLTAAGFAAEEARTGEEAVAVVKQCPFDLVLLDINMPGLSGFEACRRIRALGLRTGIVVVTVRDAEDDKVRCLEQGADDYITKPFGLRELIARLRAVLRRTQADNAAQAVLQASDWKSTSSGAFYLARENKLILRPKEFELLAHLVRNLDPPVTHVKLLRAVWGTEYVNELEYLRSWVNMLREKDNPAQPASS